MSSENKKADMPHELRVKISALDKALTDVENKFEPLLKVPQMELNASLSSIDKAKLDLVAAYSINSLYWAYLNMCGVNPKEHGIKQELDRIRGYMNRVKEIQDKEKAPRVDKSASKRFVRNALWQAAQAGEDTDTAAAALNTSSGSQQVEHEDESEEPKGKKRRKDKQDKKEKKGKKRSQKRYCDKPKKS